MKRRDFLRAGLVAAAGLALPGALAGCGGRPDPTRPPPLKLGRDVCAECGMVIRDERFAAGYVDRTTGDPVLFDDLGDLVAYFRKKGGIPPAFVHDRETKAWIPAEGAWYVYGAGVGGPHSDLAAFSTQEAARGRAGASEVLSWGGLLMLKLPGSTSHQH